MKTIATICLFSLAVLLGFLLCSQPAESQDAPQVSTDAKINKLLVERRDTLRQLLDAVTARHRVGQATINQVLRAQSGLLHAELQLANTREDRVRIREERLKTARELESVSKHQYEAAAAPRDSWLEAKAGRLQAEIDLLREQAARD